MGYMRAIEMIAFAGFDVALRDHLEHNLHPPAPATHDNVALAKRAIDAMVDGDPEQTVAVGLGSYTAAQVVEGWHLGAFVDAHTVERELEHDMTPADIVDWEVAEGV